MQSSLQSKLAPQANDRLHVGIIMDGNGRWATRQGLTRLRGHEAGVEAIRRAVEAAPDQGVGTLTLYAFSERQLASAAGRSQRLDGAVALLSRQGDRQSRTQRCAPDHDRPARPHSDRNCASDRPRGSRHHRVARRCICASRSTIRRATQSSLPRSRRRLRRPDPRALAQLITGEAGLRDVDLIIRTSGEKRLSDFLLWESAYAEFHFTERMWPDFDADDLAEALRSFHSRERRFGGLVSICSSRRSEPVTRRKRTAMRYSSHQCAASLDRQPHSRRPFAAARPAVDRRAPDR